MRKRTSVEGWVVVVTGMSSGNGKAISLALAGKGSRVVLAARRARLLEAVTATTSAASFDSSPR